jgi:hypothetical protein
MSLYSKVRGTFETLFQLGKGGPQLKNSSGAVQFRNSADSAFASIAPRAVQLDGGAIIKNSSGTLVVRDSADAAFANVQAADAIVTQAKIGSNGSLIKEAASGIISFRDPTDASFAIIRGASPSGSDDLVTKGYFDANPPAGTLRAISFQIDESLADTTQSSSTTIPANAIVHSYHVIVTAAFATGQTLTLGYTGSASALMGTGDTNLEATNVYTVDEPKQWGGSAAAVLGTLSSGTAGSGSAQVIVTYSEPQG